MSVSDWKSADSLLPAYLDKMRAAGLPAYVEKSFTYYFGQLCADETGIVRESDIRPVDASSVASFESLADYLGAGADALSRASMAKLNGGLGTSMGLERAKSLLEVKEGLSFLDITARQVEHFRATQGVPLPLVLMNSFSTEGRYEVGTVRLLRQSDRYTAVFPAAPVSESAGSRRPAGYVAAESAA